VCSAYILKAEEDMELLVTEYFKRKKLNGQLKSVKIKKGESILRPYEDTQFIYELAQGLVKVFTLDSRGKENIAVIYGPGDLFPLAWIIDEDRPPLYFKSITECKLNLVPQQIFQDLMVKDVNLYKKFTRRVLEQFATVGVTLNNLGLKYGRERLSYQLVVLAHRFGESQGSTIVIPYINQSDLGATLNMARESVSIELTRLEKMGIIKSGRSKIIINNLKKLEKEIDKNVPILLLGQKMMLP
jgi:CRP-like cAMP-binding protein